MTIDTRNHLLVQQINCDKDEIKLKINIQLIYKLLLDLIKLTVLFSRTIQIYVFQFIYFVLNVKCETKIENQYSLPDHLLIILNENISNTKDIYNLFNFITEFFVKQGVNTITFYQFDEFETILQEHLLAKYKDRNNNKKINLHFYSYLKSGRNLLTQTCKTIANKVNTNQINLSDVNKDLIDQYFKETTDISEPQLVINIGSNDSLAGFSPWHLRLSEIIKVESFKLINNYTLKNVLLKYNKIEKRFGK